MPTSSHKRRTSGPGPKKAGRPTELDPGALLDAAEKLFADKGFNGATTRELAKAAGCNVALISYHFGGKEGLYQAILKRHFDKLKRLDVGAEPDAAELARQWPELGDPDQRELCAVLFVVGMDIIADTPMRKVVWRELLTGAARMTAALSGSDNGFYRFMRRRLERLRDQGKLRPDADLRLAVIGLMAPMVYSCVATPILKHVYGFESLDRDYVRKLCLHQVRVFFEGIGA
jgi:TetR/AcrR family transcriptional regulator